MTRYVYAYRTQECDGEVFFEFPSLPEIISAVPCDTFEAWDAEAISSHAENAVLTALQSAIAVRDAIPPPLSRVPADGFVSLSPSHAMKLELYAAYAENCASIADFARAIGRHDTAARRLLNLRHRSTTQEMVEALAALGREFEFDVSTTPVVASLEVASGLD